MLQSHVSLDTRHLQPTAALLSQIKQRSYALMRMEPGQQVLDVGCGSSRIVLDLPNAVGLDIRQNKLRWLSWRRRRLVRASCERLPFADGSFDGLIHSEVIEHLPDDPAILAECHRVLRPGGGDAQQRQRRDRRDRALGAQRRDAKPRDRGPVTPLGAGEGIS